MEPRNQGTEGTVLLIYTSTTYKFDGAKMQHFGGDKKLMFEFVHLMGGKSSCGATLDAGFLSTLMCMAARKSAEKGIIVPILWED